MPTLQPIITNEKNIGRELWYGYFDFRGVFIPVRGPFKVKELTP